MLSHDAEQVGKGQYILFLQMLLFQNFDIYYHFAKQGVVGKVGRAQNPVQKWASHPTMISDH